MSNVLPFDVKLDKSCAIVDQTIVDTPTGDDIIIIKPTKSVGLRCLFGDITRILMMRKYFMDIDADVVPTQYFGLKP